MRPRGLCPGEVEHDFGDRGTSGCALFALLAGYVALGVLAVWLVWQGAGWLIRLVGG